MIGKGVEAAPALRRGFGATFGAGDGRRRRARAWCRSSCSRRSTAACSNDERRRRRVTVLGRHRRSSSIIIATVAQRTAVARLGRRSEEALYGLRVRLFEHIHRLSLADHSEERQGRAGGPRHQRRRDAVAVLLVGRAGVAARRHADGDGRRRDAGVRLGAGARRLRHRGAARARAAQRATPSRRGLRQGPGRATPTCSPRSAKWSPGSETLRAYGAGAHYAKRHQAGPATSGRTRSSAPTPSARSCSRRARCSAC